MIGNSERRSWKEGSMYVCCKLFVCIIGRIMNLPAFQHDNFTISIYPSIYLYIYIISNYLSIYIIILRVVP